MKKLLLSLFCLLSVMLSANAAEAEATIDFSKITFTNNTYTTPDGVVTVKIGGGGSDATINSGVLRFYAKNELTISVANASITDIDITTNGSYAWGKVTIGGKVADGVTANSDTKDTNNKKWSFTGETPEITLVNGNTAQVRLASIKINYTTVEKAVADVIISTSETLGETFVSLSCPTAGATIYYGYAEDAQTNVYSSRFKVTEKCIVYAHAELNGVSGEQSIKSVTPAIRYTNFKDALSAADNSTIWIVGNFSISKLKGGNLLLTDGSNYMLLFQNTNITEYAEGDNISAVKGTVTPYDNLFELQNFNLTKGGTGAESTFKEISALSEINYTDNLFEGVLMNGCTISGKSGNNATIEFGGQTVALYNRYGVDLENGENFTIKGVVSRKGDNLQIVPIAIEGGVFMETVENPEILPQQRELKEGDMITITCATEDAVIRYTLDDSEPTEDSEIYTGPFAFDVQGIGVGTVKAKAFPADGVDNMLPSETVSKTFRLFDPTCNVLNTDDHVHTQTDYSKPHTCVIDDVNYEMNALHQNNYHSIQVNGKTQTIYVIQTSENVGYVLDRIEIDYDIPHITANTVIAEFAVRGSNEVPSNTTYSSVGNSVGSITKDDNSCVFENDYKYFTLYTTKSSGATYLNSITIYYRATEDVEAPTLEDDYEFISDETHLMLPELPEAKNWSAKYSINDGDEYDYAASNCLHEEELDPATTHSIKIWYEHDLNGTTTEPKEYFHLTAPQVNVTKDEEEVIYIDFGTIGEGVKVLFTLDGTTPGATENPVEVKNPKFATAADGVYKIEEPAELTQTHTVNGDTTKVEVHPSTLASKVSLRTKAIDEAKRLESDVTAADDVTTGVALVVSDQSAEWYTIDGVKVNGNVGEGIYIVVKDGKAQKVVIRK